MNGAVASPRTIARPPSRPGAAAGLAFSVLAYGAFLTTTVWSAAFLADRSRPRGIDHGDRTAAAAAVAVDLALLGLFAVQHTVMARAGFKRWLTRRLPAGLERSAYVFASSAVLALLLWGWRPFGGTVWHLRGAAAAVAWAVFAAGWVIAISSTFMIDHLDFLGLRTAHRHARGRPQQPPPFRERALFAWIRHPLMVGLVLAFWATPRMTVGHLVFAAASTAYIAVGVRFEERDLRREPLDGTADGDDLLEPLARRPGHLDRTVRQHFERVLGDQAADGVAHRHRACTHRLRQAPQRQPFTRRDPAGQDQFLDLGVDHVGQRAALDARKAVHH